VKKRDKFKRVISFFEGFILLGIHIAIYAFVWYSVYENLLKNPFSVRGHWAVIGIYGLILFLLTNLYGGFRIGYLRLMDVLYSQVLSLVCANVVAYFQMVLVIRQYLTAIPLVKMTIVQILAILLWVFICRWIYKVLYPPRQMLLVFYDRSPSDMIKKMHTRKDKYEICDLADLNVESLESVCDMVANYEAVLIFDMPAYERNIIMKRCLLGSGRFRMYFSFSI